MCRATHRIELAYVLLDPAFSDILVYRKRLCQLKLQIMFILKEKSGRQRPPTRQKMLEAVRLTPSPLAVETFPALGFL